MYEFSYNFDTILYYISRDKVKTSETTVWNYQCQDLLQL